MIFINPSWSTYDVLQYSVDVLVLLRNIV